MKRTPNYIIIGLSTLLAFLMLSQGVLAAETVEPVTKNNHLPYLVAGFSLIWAVFFAYLFYIHRRQEELKSELLSLNSDLQDNKP